MVNKADMFWTDSAQARERLNGTVILYDGKPVYVSEIIDGDEYADNVPRCIIIPCNSTGKEKSRKKLDSPIFGRFRESPKIGWVNNSTGLPATYLERIATRTRGHGLSDNNVSVWTFQREYQLNREGSPRFFSSLSFSKEFCDCVAGSFPSLEKILINVQNGSCIAYSRTYAVYRDSVGVRWLYRGRERIGLFTGADSLNLLEKFTFYREEIMSDPLFTLNNIREY
jgi:hypothetical protein